MKNKKSLLFLGLFALVCLLCVGYAVVSVTNLNITGTASTVDAGEVKVVFTDAQGGTNATATKTDDKNATITVTGLAEIGDKATATYTIKNNETDLSASVAVPTITNDNEEFFTVTTDWDAAKTLAHGESTTITVTVTLKAVPIDEADSEANITLKLVATPVQPTA